MKSKSLAVLTMILGLALSTSAFAQGRHDEKPHAVGKQAVESPDKEKVAGGSGRHDEKPHGMRKPAAKKPAVTKDSPKVVDDKGSK